jgi:hypothetical protein
MSPRVGKHLRAQMTVAFTLESGQSTCLAAVVQPCCAACHQLFRRPRRRARPLSCNAMQRVRRLLILLNQTRADRNAHLWDVGVVWREAGQLRTSRPQIRGLIRPVRHVRDCARWWDHSHFISSSARPGETVGAQRSLAALYTCLQPLSTNEFGSEH